MVRQILLSECNEAVKVVDGKLFIGTKEVPRDHVVDEGHIPQLYCLRVRDDSGHRTHWSFVTGFDLVGKQFWFGGCNLKMWLPREEGHGVDQMTMPPCMVDSWWAIERIFDKLCNDTAGKEWGIFEEEDFEAHRQEMDWPEDDE